jgi:hypothetical protein
LKPGCNIAANESYSSKVLQNLEDKVLEKGMLFDFPDFVGDRLLKQTRRTIINILIIIKTIRSSKLLL